MSTLLAHLGREHCPVAELSQLLARHSGRREFASELIAVLPQLDPETTHRAAWLLRQLAADHPLDERDLARIAEQTDASDHWLFRLTYCQFWAETACPPPLRDQVFPYLQLCAADRRVIVRAWALSAMLHFQSDRAYRKQVRVSLRTAQRDPSKAMQARLRQLAAKGLVPPETLSPAC